MSGSAFKGLGSTALPNGTTATTQAAHDNSQKVATTAYNDAAILANHAFSYSNLKVANNASTPATKIDVSADFVTLQNGSGLFYQAPAVSGTIDCSTVGANGMDALPAGTDSTSTTSNTIAGSGSKTWTTAGSCGYPVGATVKVYNTGTPANFMTGLVTSDTGTTLTITVTSSGGSGTFTAWTTQLQTLPYTAWYYFWVIWNGSTIALLASTSSSAPTLPGGYTYYRLVGAMYYTGGAFRNFHQSNNIVMYDTSGTGTVVSGGTATTATLVDLSKIIPPLCNIAIISFDENNAGVSCTLYNNSGGTQQINSVFPNQTTICYGLILTAQTIWYKNSTTGGSSDIGIVGWFMLL